MEFQKVIENRRSMRKYKEGKTVDKSLIEELIKAALFAPSWKNSETGRYHVILSDEMLLKFRNECLAEYNRNNSNNACAIIVTAFVKNQSGFNADGTPTNELGNGWGIYDLGLQNQNLLLKAKEMGLDTLVMGIRDEVRIRELLNIDEEEIIVSVIALGYGDVEKEAPKRKKLEEVLKMY
ncbi:MAG: nitroreductase [Lachnospiraceae bacterium]|nr:nitroreductase [Lachnospiraceae bacterium]